MLDLRSEPVRTLKNDPHTSDIPIIGMSAYALASERDKAIATGCEGARCQIDRVRVSARHHSAHLCEPENNSIALLIRIARRSVAAQ